MGLVLTELKRRWPGRRIPYVIDDHDFPSEPPARKRTKINAAITAWNAEHFAPLEERVEEIDYVRFREGPANSSSPIGRQSGEQGIFCDLGGSNRQQIPAQLSQRAPTLAATLTELLLVHSGDDTNNLYHAVSDGEHWPNHDDKISGQQTKATPALAYYNGMIHIVHIGSDSNRLWHSWWDEDSGWADDYKIHNFKSNAAPALVVFNGLLYLVHLRDTSHDLVSATYDGSEWSSEEQPISGPQTRVAPALAEFGGLLHMVYLRDSSNELLLSVLRDQVWAETAIGQQSRTSPALVSDGTHLHMVYLDGDSASNQLWYSKYDGSGWTPGSELDGEFSRDAPALARLGSRIHLVYRDHRDQTSHRMWHSRLDANTSNLAKWNIVHEICHAAGLEHEHCREDRDEFVKIHWDEIIEVEKDNFEKRTADADDSGFYDYDSLMHYGSRFFAKGNNDTITKGSQNGPYTGSFRGASPNRSNFSPHDIETLHALYPDWSIGREILNQASRARPALAEFGGLLHMVHVDKSSNELWHSTFDGNEWTTDEEPILGPHSKTAPALALFRNHLYLVYLRDSSNDLWYAFLDDDKWMASPVVDPDQRQHKSQSSPAIAADDPRLHLVYRGNDSNNLYHSVLDPSMSTDWSASIKIEGQKTEAAPTLAMTNGALQLAYRGESVKLWHAEFSNNTWSSGHRIKNQTSRAAPALANYQGRLQLVHIGETSKQLWHSIYYDTWRPNVPIEGQFSSNAVAMATFRDKMVMVYLGASNELWFTQHTRWLPSPIP